MSSTSTATTSTTTTTWTTSTATPIVFQTGVQYGFYFDQSRCTGCHACAVACKDWNMLEAGPQKPLRCFQVEKGNWPSLELDFYCIQCYHCADPACVPAANGALIKEPKYGAVLIVPGMETSQDLKAGWNACPYGSISFDSDSSDSMGFKCNMCIDKLEAGENPVCVMACPMRAFDFDTMENLQKKYGSVQQIGDLPPPSTNPSVLFKARNSKKTLIPYDQNAAITLWSTRGSLPAVLPGGAAQLNVPAGTVRHGVLNLRTTTVEENQLYTTDVE
ncbi:MAG TPA: 4Fe-4S dicluster domain-containing protein [Candidatus Bathyarchaeia archaeon]|nr:4Fe-4S dicluster domain-containing protein [Candidatus Bathyarchaeia archaeon]